MRISEPNNYNRIMKILIYLILITANAKPKYDSSILKKAITSEAFRNQFNLCNNNDSLFIVDTNKLFLNCVLPEVCSKKLIYKTNNSGEAEKNIIEIYRVDKKSNTYKVYFLHKYSGLNVIITIKKINGEFKITRSERGAF